MEKYKCVLLQCENNHLFLYECHFHFTIVNCKSPMSVVIDIVLLSMITQTPHAPIIFTYKNLSVKSKYSHKKGSRIQGIKPLGLDNLHCNLVHTIIVLVITQYRSRNLVILKFRNF